MLEKIQSISLSKISHQIPTIDEVCNRTAMTEGSGSYSIEESNAVGGAALLAKTSTISTEQNELDVFADEVPGGKNNGSTANAGGLSSGLLPLDNWCGSESYIKSTALEEKSKGTPFQGPTADSKDKPVINVARELRSLSSNNQRIAQDLAVDNLSTEEHTILFEAISKEEQLFVEDCVDE